MTRINFNLFLKVQVKKDDIDLKPPPLKAAMTENKEYRADVSWPTMKELEVSESFLNENEIFYKQGMNRQRQKKETSDFYFQVIFFTKTPEWHRLSPCMFLFVSSVVVNLHRYLSADMSPERALV